MYIKCMSRTNINIDDKACAEVMRRYHLATKRAAVNFALRALAVKPFGVEEARHLRGSGWEADRDLAFEQRRQPICQARAVDRTRLRTKPLIGTGACTRPCRSEKVAKKSEKEKVGRWNCHECSNSFNVLSGTVFSGTHVPLQKWFLAISLMIHAKKSLSSHQLGRDLKLNHKTAWFMQQRIRAAMTTDEGALLQGIIEVDETYVGGKPRYKNRNNKRGRGTRKASVVGALWT